MEISTKASFSKENGMAVEKYSSQMPQSKRVYGFKIKSNDILY